MDAGKVLEFKCSSFRIGLSNLKSGCVACKLTVAYLRIVDFFIILDETGFALRVDSLIDS